MKKKTKDILTQEEVRFILKSDMMGKDLAAMFGVTPALISQIKRGKKWPKVYMKVMFEKLDPKRKKKNFRDQWSLQETTQRDLPPN